MTDAQTPVVVPDESKSAPNPLGIMLVLIGSRISWPKQSPD